MSAHLDMRGAATVGQLSAIPPWEAMLVRHLRLWCEGEQGRTLVQRDLASMTDAGSAQNTAGLLDALVQALARNCRRPLVRHGVHCDCLGADEAVFAQIASSASGGALDDAALMCGLLAMPAHAEHLAILAAQLGAAYRGLDTAAPAAGFATADLPYGTLH